mgnify:CR=1 FL=1
MGMQTHHTITEELLVDWIKEIVNQESDLGKCIFGSCIAFEPHQFDPSKELFNVYCCRNPDAPGGIETKPLSYNYLNEEWCALSDHELSSEVFARAGTSLQSMRGPTTGASRTLTRAVVTFT